MYTKKCLEQTVWYYYLLYAHAHMYTPSQTHTQSSSSAITKKVSFLWALYKHGFLFLLLSLCLHSSVHTVGAFRMCRALLQTLRPVSRQRNTP